MEAYVGVDMATGLVHSAVGTAGNVINVTQAHALLHDGEKAVLIDAGFQGMGKRSENTDDSIGWHVAMRPSVRKTLKKNPLRCAKKNARRPSLAPLLASPVVRCNVAGSEAAKITYCHDRVRPPRCGPSNLVGLLRRITLLWYEAAVQSGECSSIGRKFNPYL